MTTEQQVTLDRLKKQAKQMGGTVFVLSTTTDGTLLLSDGRQTVQLDVAGKVVE